MMVYPSTYEQYSQAYHQQFYQQQSYMNMIASSEYCYYPMHRPTGAVRNKRAIGT